MEGTQLFWEGILALLRAPGIVLRLAAWPVVLTATVTAAGVLWGNDIVVLCASFISFVFFAWMAIGWHRWLVLGEQPGVFAPRLRGMPIVQYTWRWLLIALASLMVSLPVGLLTMIILKVAVDVQKNVPPLAGVEGLDYNVAIFIAIWGSVVWLLRFGTFLPGLAAGRASPASTAKRPTWGLVIGCGLWGGLYWLVYLVLTATMAPSDWPATLIPAQIIQMALVDRVMLALMTLVAAGILTTLYQRQLTEPEPATAA